MYSFSALPYSSILSRLWSSLSLAFTNLLALFYLRTSLLKQVPQQKDLENQKNHAAVEQHDASALSSVTESTNHLSRSNPNIFTYIPVPGEWDPHFDPQKTPVALKPGSGEIIYVTKGKFLAWGGTAMVERLPSGMVIKTPLPNPYRPAEENIQRQNMRLEAQIYQKIGEHPRVPNLVNWDPDTCCLTLEYMANGNLRDYMQSNTQNISLDIRFQWVKQAAEAVSALHSIHVVHCDLSPRNFLLDSDLNLMISDFGGASVQGTEPSATPTTRFRHPNYDWDAAPVFGDDIFSLGSLIYYIMTGCSPYHDRPSDEVEKLYESQEFPDVSKLNCGVVIMQCWSRQIDTAQDVYDYLISLEKGRNL